MNREILFKAKRKDNGKWVEGYYCKTTIGNDVRPSDVIFVPFKVSRNEEWGWMKVDPDTVCQYTGLTDKNSQKIWENDIVTITIECDDYFNLSENGIVEYSYGQYELKVKTTDGKEAYSNLINKLSEAPFEIEKLGNIFDNPDLLEVK